MKIEQMILYCVISEMLFACAVAERSFLKIVLARPVFVCRFMKNGTRILVGSMHAEVQARSTCLRTCLTIP